MTWPIDLTICLLSYWLFVILYRQTICTDQSPLVFRHECNDHVRRRSKYRAAPWPKLPPRSQHRPLLYGPLTDPFIQNGSQWHLHDKAEEALWTFGFEARTLSSWESNPLTATRLTRPSDGETAQSNEDQSGSELKLSLSSTLTTLTL